MTDNITRSYRLLRIVITVLILTVLALNITYGYGSTEEHKNEFSSNPVGNLKVTKVFSGVSNVPSGWRATITIIGPEGYTESKTVTGADRTALFEDLQPGTYVVSESNRSGISGYWFVRVEGEGSCTVTAGATTEVTVRNVYEREYIPPQPRGRLRVTKEFLGITKDNQLLANWSATIRVTDGGDYNETQTLTPTNTLTFNRLVPGQQYTVTEENPSGVSGYTFVSSDGADSFTATSGTTDMVITNTYRRDPPPVERPTGSLRVIKVFTGIANDSPLLTGWRATIRVTGPNNYDESKPITGTNRTVTFGGLTPGRYVVSETDRSGITGYSFVRVDGDGNCEVEANRTTSVTITNRYTTDTTPTPTPTPSTPPPSPSPSPDDGSDIFDPNTPGGGMFVPPEPGEIPRTGDDMDARLWLMLIAVSAIILRYVLFFSKAEIDAQSQPRGRQPRQKKQNKTRIPR